MQKWLIFGISISLKIEVLSTLVERAIWEFCWEIPISFHITLKLAIFGSFNLQKWQFFAKIADFFRKWPFFWEWSPRDDEVVLFPLCTQHFVLVLILKFAVFDLGFAKRAKKAIPFRWNVRSTRKICTRVEFSSRNGNHFVPDPKFCWFWLDFSKMADYFEKCWPWDWKFILFAKSVWYA